MSKENVNIPRLAAGGSKPSNDRHTFVVKRLDLRAVELCDQNFHPHSPVMLPDPLVGGPGGDGGFHEGLALIAHALEFAGSESARKLLVLGHCTGLGALGPEIGLSERRALNVHAYRGPNPGSNISDGCAALHMHPNPSGDLLVGGPRTWACSGRKR